MKKLLVEPVNRVMTEQQPTMTLLMFSFLSAAVKSEKNVFIRRQIENTIVCENVPFLSQLLDLI